MSYQDGWAALNLEMPARVPRTEYSITTHWDVLKTVTGIDVSSASPEKIKRAAQQKFVGPECWNFDFFWCTSIFSDVFGDFRTRMGHAEYEADGSDRDDQVGCPFTDPEQVLTFDPWEKYGKVDQRKITRFFEKTYRRNCEENPEGINMTGIYITLISGLLEILGWDMLLLAAGTDAERFGAVTNRYATWVQQYFDALAAADVPVVMVHDDMVWTAGPFIHPEWYRKYIFPNLKKLLAPLRESGKKIMFTSDGNFNEFIDDIADAGVHGFVMEPLTDMKRIAETYGKTHVFIGNAETRILLFGTKAEIRAEVERCMAIGKKYPGFFMAVGNHIPANTPVENALYYNEAYEELSRR
ncbi:hypothetical protein KAH55_05170 [bacterium]|nr:hypothetical protein [bacterium]